jgi:hypothetical protein
MTTADHRHVWASTPTGFRCAYMFCSARPDAGEARAPRIEIRMVSSRET